jgi:prepilin-type N-terminal cleavage/methylation domain-containing protein
VEASILGYEVLRYSEFIEFVMGNNSKRDRCFDLIAKLAAPGLPCLPTGRRRQRQGGACRTHAGGFTFIEILVAMVILSVSLLALAGLMATTTKTNSFGNHLTEASVFGQAKLEELRAMGWENIKEGTNTDQVSGSTGINYRREWSISTKENLKTITISINWKDPMDHSIKFVSIISQ